MIQPAVLHVDPNYEWRGGQQQALYLHLGMLEKGHKSGFVCNPGSVLETKLKEQNIPYQPIRFRFEADILAGIELAIYACRNKYNLLHVHSSHALSWGLIAKMIYPSLHLVATRRVNVPIGKNIFSAIKYKSPMLNAIVAISEATQKLMEADGIPQTKIHKIYSGVDIHKFDEVTLPEDFRARWKIPQKAILVGTVAAIVPPKDYRNLITAASFASQNNPALHFMVVGDGELKGEIQALAKQLGLEGRITFTGFQRQVGQFLKAFDIFVLASKREGLGTSVLDAMSVGLPVIGTNAGGIAEMIENEVSGLLVPAKDSEALARAISIVAADEKLRLKLGTNALTRVQNFSKERMVEANIRLYESL